MMRQLKIGKHMVSENDPPLFFPDIGSFFNDDTNVAKGLIKSLHNQKAQLIKGEILNNVEISLSNDFKTSYLGSDKEIIKDLLEI